jgi:Protein of unknown function (DUF1569)
MNPTASHEDLSTNASRRPLAFASLDRVMPDVDRLLEGHTTLGHWSLSQICNHLTQSLTWTVDGFPKLAPWFVRKTIGPLVLRRILRTGRFPDGIKLPAPYLPKPGLDDRAEAEALRAALRHFASHTGPLSNHPMAGQIARADWERFHGIHCAHHLAFVVPLQE